MSIWWPLGVTQRQRRGSERRLEARDLGRGQRLDGACRRRAASGRAPRGGGLVVVERQLQGAVVAIADVELGARLELLGERPPARHAGAHEVDEGARPVRLDLGRQNTRRRP